MSTQTFAIIIGVSQYQQKTILSLPAAQVDAVNFARSLRNWGIPESNVTLFLNSEATHDTIRDTFKVLSEREEKFKLIFYFCGHGFRERENLPESYLLFYDSYTENNKCFNSITLDLIISEICKLNILESYILIDACHLRINTIVNPKLDEELRGQKISHKSLFCLLSSGIEESFESERGLYGYFTDALLRGLCKIDRSDGTTTELLDHIHQIMLREELPLPEMYNIGNQKISFISQQYLPTFHDGWVVRHDVIAKIQEALIEQRDKIICLTGEKGIGKSAICQCLASEKMKTFYMSIPLAFSDLSDCIDFFVAHLPTGYSLDQFDAEFPFTLIIVDQVERLTAEQVNILLEVTSQLHSRVILVSNQSLKNIIDDKLRPLLLDLEIPSPTLEEGKKIIKKIKEECSEEESELIYLVSQGNPLKMKKAANFSSGSHREESAELENEIKRALAAIYSCGMYIDEHLFAKTFNLKSNILNFLSEIGLIYYSEESWIPHECLFEIAESELYIDQKLALDYWCQQLEDLPENIQASKSLIITIKCFGYHEKAEYYLRTAFRALQGKGKDHLSYFLDGAEIFSKIPELTETTIFLAQILIERGEFERANTLLSKTASSSGLMVQAKLCQAQRLWHLGSAKESIKLCSELIPLIKNSSQILNGYFYRGIAHFLNGNWDEAFSDFTFVHENAEEKYYLGRSQCMLGTILGLRGSDLQLGKEYLESGSRLLMRIKDFSGAWAGWNNLGEIYWKSGEYRSSLFYLEKALELSTTLNNEGAKLETLRNLLQLHFRTSGPFAKKVTDLIHEVEKGDWKLCDKFQQVQLLNTLATAHLFRRNIKPAVSYLKSILSWTAQNSEYHVYTLSNLALLYKLMGFQEKSKEFFNRSLKLAEKMGNSIAVHQIKSDYTICFKSEFQG